MKFSTMQVSVMSGNLGDIFWDLAPLIAYTPGFDIGCNIFVANTTSTAKEYALMARLSRGTTVVSEEALPVFGYTWFKVEPGDFAILRGALRFTESNADLTVSLMERESGEATDAVATGLMAPTTSALPPAWPGTPGTTGGDGTTWNSMLGMMMPMLMFVMMGMMIAPAFKQKEEKKILPPRRSD